MRDFLTVIFIFLATTIFGNMASPYHQGTKTSTVISSKDINILSENIDIKINKEFNSAYFKIEYNISTDIEGTQIPLLFIAEKYKNGFKVWVDDLEVKTLDIPKEYTSIKDSPFDKFSESLKVADQSENIESITIHWSSGFRDVYYFNDLKYFETSLTKGEHKIRVEYSASPWVSRWGLVNKYSFDYSLAPAKFWKSFGKLNVKIDFENYSDEITTNLGETKNRVKDNKVLYSFNELPADSIKIAFTPEIKGFAKTLADINPSNLALASIIILFLFHVFILFWKKEKITTRYNLLLSLIISFVPFMVFILSYKFIASSVGEHKTVMINYYSNIENTIFYPILFIPYFFLMIIISIIIKIIIKKRKIS
ncbi:hypothetical protein JXR93_12935 [bacterium]|nr:hypothetical protein [bacterium]